VPRKDPELENAVSRLIGLAEAAVPGQSGELVGWHVDLYHHGLVSRDEHLLLLESMIEAFT
jgi:hypothetical protein